jgi:hypothetical protein
MPHLGLMIQRGTTMIFKPWLLYAIISWQGLPPVPIEEQKTIILQFNDFNECLSVTNQVESQIKAAAVPFRIKQLACVPCTELYERDRCTAPVVKQKR